MRRAVIFINGQFPEAEAARGLVRPDDYLIAVNGGTRHALNIGKIPHVIIGDLDSLSAEIRAQLAASPPQFLQYPARKDETDLELALRHAQERHVSHILFLAALGGRIDQSLANVLLLTLPGLEGIDAQIVEGNQRAFVIRQRAAIRGTPGDTVSILPIGGDAAGVSNRGFEWPLRDATLSLGATRGISNMLCHEEGHISVRNGMLLCVVTHINSTILPFIS